MNPSHPNGDSSLEAIIAEYVTACEKGENPDRQELVERHPDLAEDLKDFFRHRDRMEALLDPIRSAASKVLNIRCPHCRNSIELVDDAEFSSINCPSCGSNFSLVGMTTTGHSGSVERIGQFQLIEQAGAGQFGTVWKARDLSLERTVAIKIPRQRQMTDAETEVFLRDARISAQLKHPNIVGVHEVGKHEGTIYIVSDFIQGASLKEWITAKRLTTVETAKLAIKIANALQHAHDAGIVHRDLKPGNIMMDLQGEPHLVDFGLARKDAGEITMTIDGQILGTPAYMSPEQAKGEAHHVDGRADIYALGVIIFELLTGELPFRGDKKMLLVQIISDDPPYPRRLNSTIPRDLETICLKCLRKEPAKRYATAKDLANDLTCWLETKPIIARPVGILEKARMWCIRRPAISSLIGVLALVIIAAVLSSREIQRRERAKAAVESILAASDDIVLEKIDDARDLDRLVQPIIQMRLQGNLTEQERVHLSLARLRYDPELLSFLIETALHCSPKQLLTIREGIVKAQDTKSKKGLSADLWEIVANPDEIEDKRLRSAGLLAGVSASDERWESAADELVAQLVSQPVESVPDWIELFQPIRQYLLAPLDRAFKDPQYEYERVVATTALASYLAEDPDRLAEAINEADPDQLYELVPKLEQHPEAAQLLKTQLALGGSTRSSLDKENEFDDPPTKLVEEIRTAVGIVESKFAMCTALPIDRVIPLCNSLREFGYRPIRCRPFLDDNALFASIIWTRDGKRWGITNYQRYEFEFFNLKVRSQFKENFQRLVDTNLKLGLRPQDVAAYWHNEKPKAFVIWCERETHQDVKVTFFLDRNWQSNFDRLRDDEYVPEPMQIFRAPNGRLHRSQIWLKPGLRPYRWQASSLKQPIKESLSNVDDLLIGTCLYYGSDGEASFGSTWARDGQTAYRVLRETMDVAQKKYQNLSDRGYYPVSISAKKHGSSRQPEVVTVWHQQRGRLALGASRYKSSVNNAIALMMLGEPEPTKELLRYSSDPLLRSYLIEHIGSARVDPRRVLDLLEDPNTDDSVRQALVLCLTKYGQLLSPYRRQMIATRVFDALHSGSDAGVVAAAEHLYQEWQLGDSFGSAKTSKVSDVPGSYFIDKDENRMIVIMLPNRLPIGLRQHAIDPRDQGTIIAISSAEVTIKQFQKFRRKHNFDRNISPTVDCPANNVTWFDAIEFCNHLSDLHGLQRCYEPNEDGQFGRGMRIPDDATSRTGYRLPTTIEAFHFAMAEAETDFCYGDDPTLLSQYAWYQGSFASSARPVRSLLPNVLGFYDVHGNVAEWCHDIARGFEGENYYVLENGKRYVMGGHKGTRETMMAYRRSRQTIPANSSNRFHGFRVARTIVPPKQRPSAREIATRKWLGANWLGQHGQWREAAEQMQSCIHELESSVNHWVKLFRAWHHLEETQKANDALQEIVRRFGNTNDPSIAHLAASSCLAALDFEITDDVKRLAEIAQSGGALFRRDIGMLHYRLGNYEQAEKDLLVAASSPFRLGKPVTTYVLAMTYYQQGRKSKSAITFNSAERLRKELLQGFTDGDYGDQWHGWLSLESMRRMAMDTIKARPSP